MSGGLLRGAAAVAVMGCESWLGLHIHIKSIFFCLHFLFGKCIVVGGTKMGNIVLRAGLETRISGIPGQCATSTTTPCRLPDVTTIIMLMAHLSTQLLASEVDANYYSIIFLSGLGSPGVSTVCVTNI